MKKLLSLIQWVFLSALLLQTNAAMAATFAVNSTADTGDFNPGDNVCETGNGNGVCTLRAAIEEANALGSNDVINVPAGTYAVSNDLDIANNGTLIINGASTTGTLLDGGGSDRVIDNPSGANLTLNLLTVQNGNSVVTGDGNQGGGIRNLGTLTVNRVAVLNNTGRQGGGIWNRFGAATLTVTDSTIAQNSSDANGAGVFTRQASATFTRVTFNNNNSSNDGGALFTRDQTTNVTNVTISGNSASSDGGGVRIVGGTLAVVNTTFANNTAPNDDNISLNGVTATFSNTIVDNNGNGDSCSGGLTSLGGNLAFGDAGTCGFTSGDPVLGALTNNGGFTETHAITAGSPAIDIGTGPGCPATDQTGTSRPQGSACDSGAFEASVAPSVDLELSMSDDIDPVTLTSLFTYMMTVENIGSLDATGVVLTDNLPVDATYESVISSQGSCSHNGTDPGGILTCTIGDIPTGASVTVELTVRAPSFGIGGGLNNTASVVANESETNTANNSASENTQLVSNTARLCYVVADGGNRLIEFDTSGSETDIGSTNPATNIEAIAYHSGNSNLYAANAGQFGTLNQSTGAFTFIGNFGTGGGAQGEINLNDVDGLSYDADTGDMFGVDARSGNSSGTGDEDLLFKIDIATGSHIPNAFGPGIDYVEIDQVGSNHITDDIAVDPTTGIMYASVNNGGTTDRLIIIDKDDGSTTDIALITVPDIEGLGTDFSGQLWGTSGTQEILYEIDKSTGVGSNGVPISTGSDHEAVDCFAISPTVAVDIAVTKGVDDATPMEGDTIVYTIGVTNNGPSTASSLQIMDLLPTGVTFVSATPDQGIYDDSNGNWFIGTLNATAVTSMTITATVDAGTGGTTITNTAFVEFVSQGDTNSSNDSASVDIDPTGGANLLVLKSSSIVRDPLGAVAPAAHAIPNAVVEYTVSVSNSGAASATSVVVTDAITNTLSFLAGEYNGGAADIEITIGATAPIYCVAELGSDTNSDGCFLDADGDFLTVGVPVSGSYPDGLTVGTTAPNNVATVRFRATIN
ncbi:MAG: choice-of-anchor Q domain-containing protein [Gammaproteobacteria bacterium]